MRRVDQDRGDHGARKREGRAARVHRWFGDFASMVARAAGKPLAFMLALLTVVIWSASGPLFGFSDTWQLVINTGTTIVTFLMVFLIQSSQNRDNAALQVKLDELVRVSAAQNVFVGIEHLSDEELEQVRLKCEARAKSEDRKDRAARRAGRKVPGAAEHG